MDADIFFDEYADILEVVKEAGVVFISKDDNGFLLQGTEQNEFEIYVYWIDSEVDIFTKYCEENNIYYRFMDKA